MLVLGLGLGATAQGQNIVTNPGFESGATGWSIVGAANNYPWKVSNGTTLGLSAHSGTSFAYMGCIGTACANQTGGNSSLAQTLTTVPGTTYTLSFWLQNNTNSQPSTLLVTWGGLPVLYVDPLPGNAPGYLQYTVPNLVATSASTVLSFYGRQDPSYFAIDDVSVVPQYAVSGRVLLDNGKGGGTANDGVANGGEPGHAGVALRLTNCGSTTYGSAVSDANGNFTLFINAAPAGVVCVVETLASGFVPVSWNAGTTAGSYAAASTTLRFTLAANTSYSGILFGEVAQSSFTTDGAQQIVPGQIAVYPHSFTAGDSASLAFASSNLAAPAMAGWASVLYLDAACSGTLSPSDSVLTGPIVVSAGQQVCILDRVSSPPGAGTGAQDVTTVSVTETLQPTPLVGAIVRTWSHADTTTIGSSGLTLLKQVRNVATCPSTAADTQTFGTANQAGLGGYVEYQITFTNGATVAITGGIRIDDAVPAYTLFQSAQCGVVPPGESSCTVAQAPAVGAGTGAVAWTLSDAAVAPIGLQPGGSGNVRFCVKVAQ